MQKFLFDNTEIEGLKIVNPFYTDDKRGSFTKFFEKNIFNENNINFNVIEAFETVSREGTIRGLHFQTEEPQAKLLRVQYGKIMDVVVDLRKDSKTFGKHHSEILSAENKKSLYVPRGFAHGFICLSDIAIVLYLCDSKYSSDTDGGILWSDKDLNINWNINNVEGVIVSEKDQKLQTFKEFCNRHQGF